MLIVTIVKLIVLISSGIRRFGVGISVLRNTIGVMIEVVVDGNISMGKASRMRSPRNIVARVNRVWSERNPVSTVSGNRIASCRSACGGRKGMHATDIANRAVYADVLLVLV